jgi:hypothetical protein
MDRRRIGRYASFVAAIYEVTRVAVKLGGEAPRFHPASAFSQNPHLLNRINVIWGVQSRLQK